MTANHFSSFESQNLSRYEYRYFCNSAASLPIIFTNEDGEISGMAIAVPGFICDSRSSHPAANFVIVGLENWEKTKES